MDLQRWMPRFQVVGNRFVESWSDLSPDLELTSPEAIACVNRRRQAHEAQQQTAADLAATTPGADPHINVPWTEDTAINSFN